MSTIKMKVKEVLALQKGLEKLNGEQATMKGADFKFKYAVARNTSKIDRQVDDIKSTTKWSARFQEYYQKRIALRLKMCAKDGGGKPVVMNGDYVLPDEDAFEEAHKEIAEEYKDVIDEKKVNDEKFNNSMDEMIDVEVHLIEQAWIPEDISPGYLSAIILLVKES